MFEKLFGLVDELFTSDEERENAKFKLLEMHQKGQLAQLMVNAEEAKHASIWVAGWRPWVGWVCGSALALNCVILPLLQHFGLYVAAMAGADAVTVQMLQDMPTIDLAVIMPVLLGMLGLGAMRTYEKEKGIARINMKD